MKVFFFHVTCTLIITTEIYQNAVFNTDYYIKQI